MKNIKTIFILLIVSFLPISLFALSVGDRVLGKWSDGYWYPATVISINGGKAEIDYDDGDNAIVPVGQVKSINWKIGTKLECNYQSAGSYYSGIISDKKGDSIHINYDDGDKEDTTIGHCRSK